MKLIKILVLCLLPVTLAIGLAACGLVPSEEPATTQESTTDPTQAEDAVPTPATPLTVVRADGTCNYTVYHPMGIASSSSEILLNFADALREKTGCKKIPVFKVTATPKNDFEITINVSRNRADAAKSYFATALTDYELTTNGNRIIVTAFSNEALQYLLDEILSSLTKTASGEWVLDAASLHRTGTMIATEEAAGVEDYVRSLSALPHFATQSGTLQPLYALSKNAYQFAVTNTTAEEYKGYLANLESLGYTCYSDRTLSAGSETAGSNRYVTYVKESIHLFVSWQENLKVVRVACSLPAPLPALTKSPATAVITPTVAQMQLHEGVNKGGTGMSYVIQLEDGRFILVDGGVSNRFACDVLVDYLKQQAKKAGMETPVIAMWIFSHPDDDHIGQARARFLQVASENAFLIQSFAYNFADDNNVTSEDNSGYIMSLEHSINRYYPRATIYTPHAGQVYYFAGMQLEILSTEEEVYPLETVYSHNDAGITWRLRFDSGKTVLFLGDNHPAINTLLAKVYRDYLKSDVLQVAHHGLTGAELSSYQLIDPDICLWSTSYARFSGIYDGNMDGIIDDDQWCIGYMYREGDPIGHPSLVISEANVWIRDDSIKQRDHYHASQTTVLDMNDLEAPPRIIITEQYD